jgi:hypothetical protein
MMATMTTVATGDDDDGATDDKSHRFVKPPAITHEVLRMNQEGLVISQDGWIGFVVG